VANGDTSMMRLLRRTLIRFVLYSTLKNYSSLTAFRAVRWALPGGGVGGGRYDFRNINSGA
jgi:hypothetical protein